MAIVDKLMSIIAQANSVTGAGDVDVTSAVQSLIDGYGHGEGAGGDYNITSVDNGDGTQTLTITDAEGGGGGGGFAVPDGFKIGSFTTTSASGTSTGETIASINHGLGRMPTSIIVITDYVMSGTTIVKSMVWHNNDGGEYNSVQMFHPTTKAWGGSGDTYANITDVTSTSFKVKNTYGRYPVNATYIWIVC